MDLCPGPGKKKKRNRRKGERRQDRTVWRRPHVSVVVCLRVRLNRIKHKYHTSSSRPGFLLSSMSVPVPDPALSYPMPQYMYTFSPQSPTLPVRPKRRQVKNACTNCQKACKKCDDARPCLRCVKYGISEECVDSQRKQRKKGIKRGPYKKRDGRGASLPLYFIFYSYFQRSHRSYSRPSWPAACQPGRTDCCTPFICTPRLLWPVYPLYPKIR